LSNGTREYATTLGLDANRVISEVLARTHTARVREDFRGGALWCQRHTTLFINGMRHEGGTDALLATLIERGL
jgi:hypothetical protein